MTTETPSDATVPATMPTAMPPSVADIEEAMRDVIDPELASTSSTSAWCTA